MQVFPQTDTQPLFKKAGAVLDDESSRADHTIPQFDQVIVALHREPELLASGEDFGLPHPAVVDQQSAGSDVFVTEEEILETPSFEDVTTETEAAKTAGIDLNSTFKAPSALKTEKLFDELLKTPKDQQGAEIGFTVLKSTTLTSASSMEETTELGVAPAVQISAVETVNADPNTSYKYTSLVELQPYISTPQQVTTKIVELQNTQVSQPSQVVSSDRNQSLIRPIGAENEISGPSFPRFDTTRPPNLGTLKGSPQSTHATLASEKAEGGAIIEISGSTLFNISPEVAVSHTQSLQADVEMTINPNSMVPRSELGSARPEIGHHVARQLANVAKVHQDQPVELNLSPEELGRVRLTVLTVESGVTVTLSAERSETLELMRRHIEFLTKEFGEIGFSDVTFSFSQSHRNPEDVPEQQAPVESVATTDATTEIGTSVQLLLHRAEGLDLRL